MKKYFSFEGANYRVEVTPNGSPSNYNRNVAIFRIGEKTPLIGWVCKESTRIGDCISHFKLSWQRYQNEYQIL